MNQESADTQITFAESHPWITLMKAADQSPDDDSVGEVIRYTLDEIRYA